MSSKTACAAGRCKLQSCWELRLLNQTSAKTWLLEEVDLPAAIWQQKPEHQSVDHPAGAHSPLTRAACSIACTERLR